MSKKLSEKSYKYLGISPEAKVIFDDIAEVYKDKIDTALDFGCLATYCEACVRMERINLKARDADYVIHSKNGETYINPIFNLMAKCSDEISRYATKLGLEPSSRKKMNIDSSILLKNKEKSAVDEVLGL